MRGTTLLQEHKNPELSGCFLREIKTIATKAASHAHGKRTLMESTALLDFKKDYR